MLPDRFLILAIILVRSGNLLPGKPRKPRLPGAPSRPRLPRSPGGPGGPGGPCGPRRPGGEVQQKNFHEKEARMLYAEGGRNLFGKMKQQSHTVKHHDDYGMGRERIGRQR